MAANGKSGKTIRGGAGKLTQQERQEIIRYLEADQPLPDKYRFYERQHFVGINPQITLR